LRRERAKRIFLVARHGTPRGRGSPHHYTSSHGRRPTRATKRCLAPPPSHPIKSSAGMTSTRYLAAPVARATVRGEASTLAFKARNEVSFRSPIGHSTSAAATL